MKYIQSTLIALTFATTAYAGTPLGGITIAASGDGKKLVAGGDTRTLVVLNPETLEVTERHWTEGTITSLCFSKNGSVLVVGESDSSVRFFDTATWKQTKQLDKYDSLVVSPTSDLIAGVESAFTGSIVRVAAVANGAEKARFNLPKGERVAALGIYPDGTKLAVLGDAKDDPSEKKAGYNDVPKELKDVARDEFMQKNDGKSATLYLFDIAGAKPISEKKLWFHGNNSVQLVFAGEDVIATSYTNLNARISPDGTVKMFQTNNTYNYGQGVSADGAYVFTGGLRNGTILKLSDLSKIPFTISKIAGFPEYIKGFNSTAAGVCYGATSAYRVFKFSLDGKVIKEAPIK
jgi:WD40 repeat protein